MRMMLCGGPGSGKTTAAILGSLQAGKRVFAADFDCDIATWLAQNEVPSGAALTSAALADEERLSPLAVEIGSGRKVRQMPKSRMKARALPAFLKLFYDEWKVPSLDQDAVLILDSSATFADAIKNYYVEINEAGDFQPFEHMADVNAIERKFYKGLRGLSCHVIVTSWIDHIALEQVVRRGEKPSTNPQDQLALGMSRTQERYPTLTGRRNADFVVGMMTHIGRIDGGSRRVFRGKADDDTPYLQGMEKWHGKDPIEAVKECLS